LIPLRDNIPTKRFPFINWLIIIANGYAFFLELNSGPQLNHLISNWALTPKNFFLDIPGQAYTAVTATFLHGGWMHIISNMLFLHIFGDNVEDRLGHFKYLIFYFLVGICANVSQAATSMQSTVPLLGASGAIAGVLGSYFFFYPHSKVVTLIPIGFFITMREIPAFFFLGFWFLIQMFNGTFSHMAVTASSGGVAWWAHASGFIVGLLFAPFFGGKRGKYR